MRAKVALQSWEAAYGTDESLMGRERAPGGGHPHGYLAHSHLPARVAHNHS